jgi:hypothetical protein
MPLVLTLLSAEEVAQVGAWIDAGAPNDSTWTQIFRFTWEQRKCGMCHQDWGGFNPSDVHTYLTTQSTYSGPLISPGDADGSLVYQRVSGATYADQMPLLFDFVDDVTVERIGQWIDEGAVYE